MYDYNVNKLTGGSTMYYKAYKFRIYPNENQRTLINKTLGCTRFVYNYFLNMLKKMVIKKRIKI